MEIGYVKAVGIYLCEAIKIISKKQKSPLQPLFEALTNSFEAIHPLNKGKIVIRLYINQDLYTDKKGKSKTENFEFSKLIVSDNGKGFDETEFKRFSTLWDNSKLPTNRGTGRVQFLHFFDQTHFLSIYQDRSNVYKQSEFVLSKSLSFLAENALIRVDKDENTTINTTLTTLTFTKPNEPNDEKFYSTLTAGIIKELVIKQFLDYFCENRNILPKIVIERYIGEQCIETENIVDTDIPNPDNSGMLTINYSKLLKNKVIPIERTEWFNLKVFVLDKKRLSKNEIVLTSKGSVAKSYPIECLLDKDTIKGKRYLVLVSGQYIDNKDSDDRGELKILSEADYREQYKDYINPDEVILLDNIINQTNVTIRTLCPEIQEKYKEKQDGIEDLKRKFLLNERAVLDARAKIRIDDTDEDILTKVYQSKAKMSAKKDAEINQLLKEVKLLDPSNKNYKKKVANLCVNIVTKVPEQNKNDLEQYIARRRIVLECFNNILNNEIEKLKNGGRIDEKILHNLIFQQSTNDPESSDLWLINEEFIYYHGYSDIMLSQIEYKKERIFKDELTEEEKKALNAGGENRLSKRPDVLLFPDEGKCVLIEFKAPDVNVTDHLAQIDKYASLILNYTKKKFDLKTFYGYLIGESIERRDVLGITGTWVEAVKFKYFYRPPANIYAFDDRGNGSLYTEVIKYSVLLERAKLRNKIFIDKLGIGAKKKNAE
jgi:hypothetical protein